MEQLQGLTDMSSLAWCCTISLRRLWITFPNKAFNLAKKAADVPCKDRAQLAQDILDTPDPELGNSLAKIKAWFKEALEECAEGDGTINAALWELLIHVGEHQDISAQDVEGCNNMLAEVCKRAPHIARAIA